MLKVLSVILALAFVSTVIGQPPPPAPAGRGSSKPSGWPSAKTLPASDPFISLEGRFAIDLPKDIQGFAALSPKQTGTNATGQQYTWKFAEAEVILIYLDFPDSQLSGSADDLARITANTKQQFLNRIAGAKLLSENQAIANGLPSSRLTLDLGAGGLAIVQLYLDKNRVYRIDSRFKDRENEKVLQSVLKTFKVIAQDVVDAELQKKYEAMKPAPLPQTPVVAKSKTDAEDHGLKGRVKKVVEESEDRSGTWSVQGRQLSAVSYYNENGALVQEDFFDSQGNPFQITVYGYIDGKRVSNSKVTRYEYDPPPGMAPPAPKANEPAAKRDPRYEYSFEYKYENGKRVEQQMFFSNGKKGLRYVYKHSPNQVEALVYTAEGDLNQRYLSILDTDGNEIEKTNFGLTNYRFYGDRKYRYTYEFDEEGNWIKRTTTSETNENGVTSFKPYSVHYRTITYF